MKIIVFIFSIYLLVLPGMACAETDGCTDELQSSVTQTGNHTQHEQEDCGAFCTCSCCVHIVSVSFQIPVIIIDKPVVKGKLLSCYNNILLPSNYFGNIWQPPKIG
ncbi:MAG: DUF6660 family protein [Ferruginibacter sp.]